MWLCPKMSKGIPRLRGSSLECPGKWLQYDASSNIEHIFKEVQTYSQGHEHALQIVVFCKEYYRKHALLEKKKCFAFLRLVCHEVQRGYKITEQESLQNCFFQRIRNGLPRQLLKEVEVHDRLF